MLEANYIINFLDKAISNKDINGVQLNLYTALWYSWIHNNYINPMSISREDIMKISKIQSTATYHKTIKSLHDNGFIIYTPSFNPFKSSQVFLKKL